MLDQILMFDPAQYLALLHVAQERRSSNLEREKGNCATILEACFLALQAHYCKSLYVDLILAKT